MRLSTVILLACLAAQAAAGCGGAWARGAAAGSASPQVSHLASLACIDPDTGEWFSPLGLAEGIAGNLYVVDGDNSRIFSTGDTLGGLVFFADCPQHLDGCRLVDLVADAGWLYVSDRGHGLVLVLDSEGRLVRTCEVGASVGGIGLGDAGQVYAAMTLSGSVVILDVYGEQSPITCPVSGAPEGSYPVDCLVERASKVLVTDAFSRRVLVLGILGKDLGALEGFDFSSPFGICSVRGLTLVSDSELGLVAVFDEHGEFLATFGEGLLSTPGFIEAGNDGTVWVADTGRMTIEVFRIEESDRAQD